MAIAVIGYGVVGSGVVEVLDRHKVSIEKKTGKPMDLKYILDLRDFSDSKYKDIFIKDFSIIEKDKDIDIVVECIGGIHPAYDFVKSSLLSGKSVATSNKQLVAEKGDELLKVARENGVFFFFEASVGGGVPIIRPMNQCLAANDIYEVAGIVNGTTNFILSKMISEKMGFDEALNLAMDLGYAERRDPSDDIDGIDACRKICILASLAFGFHIFPKYVKTDGIRDVLPIDIEYSKKCGYAVKLIARAKKDKNGNVLACVSTAFVPSTSQLASVDDVFNGILVRGDILGDVVFYGRGAGKLPTASAVVADIIDITINKTLPEKAIYWDGCDESRIISSKNEEVRMYVCCNEKNYDILKVKKIFTDIEELPTMDHYCAFISSIGKSGDLNKKVESLAMNGIDVKSHIVVLDY